MIKNRYKSILNKWKKKYDKTGPKKVISLALKHLKNQIKRGDLNSSCSSQESEELKPIKRKNKKTKIIEPNFLRMEIGLLEDKEEIKNVIEEE